MVVILQNFVSFSQNLNFSMVGFICLHGGDRVKTDLSKYGGTLPPWPPGSDSPDTGTQTFAISLMYDGIDSYHKVELYSYKHSKNNPEKYCGLWLPFT